MIVTATLNSADQGQLKRKELARAAWREGDLQSAIMQIRSVTSERMSPAVAAECHSAEAGFLADAGDFEGSLEALRKMAPFLDAADVRIRGTYYNGRARAHSRLGDIQAALLDYTGALALWQEHGDRNYEGAARMNIAEMLLRLDEVNEARANIDMAFSVLPLQSEYWPDAYDTKSKVLLQQGQTALALEAIEHALNLAAGNEKKQAEFAQTKEAIKDRLLDLMVPLVNMKDIKNLKIQAIRNALDVSDGSITSAAKMLGTSHQVIAYVADKKSLERIKRKKSIIKNLY